MKNKRILFTASLAVLFLVVIISAVMSADLHNKNGDDLTVNSSRSESVTDLEVRSQTESRTSEPATKDSKSENTQKEEETAAPSTTPLIQTTPADTTLGETTTRPATTEPTTKAAETPVETTAATSGSGTESISFSIIKYNSTDYNFFIGKKYMPVSDLAGLKDYARASLDNLKEQKDVKYFISPKGTFDTMVNNMNSLRAVASPSNPDSIYARDVYLYRELSLDYQTYYAKGFATFFITKVQNAGDYDVYALCYYSYESKAQIQAVDTEVARVVAGFTGSTYDRILQAHDYVLGKVTYATGSSDLIIHTAYGALVNGSAVCEGYAKAYKLLLDAMGIQNDVVINTDHAWNEVLYNNEWYFVDTTNDDASSFHALFMLGRDALYYDGNLTIDGFSFQKNGLGMTYYQYPSGKNTSVRSLSSNSIPDRILNKN